MSEIMPTRLRSKAFSLFVSLNWGCNLLIGLLTLSAIDGLGGVKSSMDDDEQSDAEKRGVAILYFIFGIISVLSLGFIQTTVPETRGKTPEELMVMSKYGGSEESEQQQRLSPSVSMHGKKYEVESANVIASPLIAGHDDSAEERSY